ncbi:DMT family transporter [Vibrio cholerae]|nr:DMT family transporter [Vibrio cholerae]
MSFVPIILVLFSALLHAGWNIIGKRYQSSGPSFFLGATSATSLLLTPYILWYFNEIGWSTLPTQFWLLLVVSGLSQMVYMLGLAFAYSKVDIGIAYPLARGLPVLLVGAGTVMLGYDLQLNQWLGFGLITLGCVMIPLQKFRQFRFADYANLGIVWALVAALGTAGYSIIDKEALAIIEQTVGSQMPASYSAVLYLGIQFWAMCIPLAIWYLLTGQRAPFVEAWRIRYTATLAGLMMGGTYSLVLYAMTLTENVSFIVALRQTSIVFGLFMGIAFLGERWYVTRLLGVSAIVAGLVVAFAR